MQPDPGPVLTRISNQYLVLQNNVRRGLWVLMNSVASVFKSTPASAPSLQFPFLLEKQYVYNSEDPWLTLKLSTSGKKCTTSK